jgi:hypothetical protein
MDLRSFLRHKAKQTLRGTPKLGKPYFGEVATEYFAMRVAECSSYLEYGAGSSTVLACQSGKPCVSVDSDKLFLAAVANNVPEDAPSKPQLLHADIGIITEWGYPLFRSQSARRTKSWSAYTELPWQAHYIPNKSFPDLILVDGRFRVASALTSALHLDGQDYELLVDDYVDRPWLKPIESFLNLRSMQGRIASFGPARLDHEKIREAILQHSLDPR